MQIINKSSQFYGKSWVDNKEYIEEYKAVIKQRERNRIPFCHQSPQYSYRPYLVEYLRRICIERKLSLCCLHLTIYLLDIFMDNHAIIAERLLITTNSCLLLAAKIEENSMTMPRIAEINSAINNRYSVQEYKDMEIIILKFFHWFVMFPTSAHYVHFYLQAIISDADLKPDESKRSLFYKLNDSASAYLNQIIENIHYMQCYNPSKLAAAVIAASRSDHELSSWTQQLEDMTDFTTEDIEDAVTSLVTKDKFLHCNKCIKTNVLPNK